MTILDSSVWIALLDIDDSQHEKARKALSNLQWPVLVPEYVLLEVCSVLTRVRKELADEFIERVENSNDVQLLYSNELFCNQVLETFREYPRNDLSFVDMALLKLSEEHGLVTFDKKLQRAIK